MVPLSIGEKVIMSGMFYSLEEAAQKLNKTKDEVKKIVKDGQLREFRDGPNVLFKVDEVDALIPEADIPGPSEEEPVEMESEMEIPEPAAEEEPVELEPEMEVPELAEEPAEEAVAEEPVEEVSEEKPLDLEPELEEMPVESDELPDFDMETSISEIPELEATGQQETEEKAEEPAVSQEDEDLDSILLAPETGAPAPEMDGDLTDGDTALVGQGTSILGLTDNQEYDLTDDTMADTVILEGTSGGLTGEGLDEIEGDVNLDSFGGTGSGLLDLSLQADDTLGGILDEIYTDESAEPALAPEPVSGADIAAESGGMVPEDVSLTPQISPEITLPMGPAAAQVAPDSQSNILGIVLFIPIITVLYAAIVVFSGTRGILPSILTMIQIWIWPIMGALAAVSLITAVAAVMLTGEKTASVKKEKKVKKPKKEKPPKPKKEKKPKKAK